MHINALVQQTADSSDKHVLLQEMVNICAFDPTRDDLKRLDNCKCFPVRSQPGIVNCISRSTDFAIIDRREYGALFTEKLNMLDFTLEEVHSIRTFLNGMGLEERYLSKAVKPKTSAEGGSLNQELQMILNGSRMPYAGESPRSQFLHYD